MKCLQNMQIDAITAQFVRIQMERVVDSMKIYSSLLDINFVFVECKWNSKRINYKLAFVHFLFNPRHVKIPMGLYDKCFLVLLWRDT